MHRPFVRLVIAVSLDGRLAPACGGLAQLGGEGDRDVLEEALAWSDGAFLGGGTLNTHRATCLIKKQDLINKRLLKGQSEQPIALVISRGLEHQLEWPFFRQPIERWLLCPPKIKFNSEFQKQSGYDREISIGRNMTDTLKLLGEEGLRHLILLGGAKLITSFLREDLVDELQLTFTPRLLGGENTWVSISLKDLPLNLQSANAWVLHSHTSIGGGELMLRYFRQRDLKGND